MRITLKAVCVAGLFASMNGAVFAGPISVPNTFASGSPAVAAEVNDNFTSIVTGVNAKINDFGTDNLFLGAGAGNLTTSGVGGNTASGSAALSGITTGYANTASGIQAMLHTTIGFVNTAMGSQALKTNTIGGSNTAIGAQTLFDNLTGGANTAVGFGALQFNQIGSGNIGIGTGAGGPLVSGDGNIYIGAGAASANEASTIRIGTTPSHTRFFVAGVRNVTTGMGSAIQLMIDLDGQLGTVSSSRRVKDNIADMGESSGLLMELRPVTFHYKNDKNPKGRTLQYGLVAEEVAKVAPGLVARSADGKIETVYYQFLAPMLLNEAQKQQRTIDAQNAELKTQATEIAELKQQVARVSRLLAQLEQASTATPAAALPANLPTAR